MEKVRKTIYLEKIVWLRIKKTAAENDRTIGDELKSKYPSKKEKLEKEEIKWRENIMLRRRHNKKIDENAVPEEYRRYLIGPIDPAPEELINEEKENQENIPNRKSTCENIKKNENKQSTLDLCNAIKTWLRDVTPEKDFCLETELLKIIEKSS